ncbi:MAG: hypothetical protein B7Y59_07020 [Burkholderiales bacterium 35-55-47]|jgi:hypothetical protein|uniref:TPM domain-containing protein n=1 Tax=Limnohabitans sp. TaxID=1907725 RepID=UPI000BCAC306|nr:TPM domain-containing protein [Limnohabitans sp.]OYY18841.1 MAG: hypothetical protein B7Y59_07020 [Burkholderiales bacterium 35-55-47]OYZ73660.1 MAG: hypothetical protein B7Y06_06450 [Burkholderiales bacterium 24-55-52]OZB00805.1 MAG: hypothetical protein B7X62_06465 [Burkholderiales bacterium 39-55-53]HQR85430.1 TPM domain-containing protein [Limnohabitans sp.]HQS26653.1 TPM domain-containing protein [Limnohabitans sp.]
MDIKRIIEHLFFTDWQTHRAFSKESLRAIEKAIHESEQLHGGEIRFAIEGSLDGFRLLKGQSSRERAIEVFSQLRVWDTERNNGVLIYVLLADHAVEIVADRGIHTKVGDESWHSICQEMQSNFSKSQFEKGALTGIAALAIAISNHFPSNETFVNDLSDTPVMLT